MWKIIKQIFLQAREFLKNNINSETIANAAELLKKIEELEARLREEKAKSQAKTNLDFIESVIKSSSAFKEEHKEDLLNLLECAQKFDKNGANNNAESSLINILKSALSPKLSQELFACAPPQGNANSSDFSGKQVDPEKMKLHQAALDYLAKNQNLTYAEAVSAVNKTN